jgi:hypothetical protein
MRRPAAPEAGDAVVSGAGGGAAPRRAQEEEAPPAVWAYALLYALYVLILVLCYVSFWTWRSTAEVVVGYVFRTSDGVDAVYLALVLGIGLLLFGLALMAEPYLRRALDRPRRGAARRAGGPLRRLTRRFVQVTGLLVGAIVAGLLLQDWALTGAVTAPTPTPWSGYPPGAATAAAFASGQRPAAPAASTQERGAPTAGLWLGVTCLVVGVTVLLAAARRHD